MKEGFEVALESEIDWHDTHRGTSNKDINFESGFIAGLAHALSLYRKIAGEKG